MNFYDSWDPRDVEIVGLLASKYQQPRTNIWVSDNKRSHDYYSN